MFGVRFVGITAPPRTFPPKSRQVPGVWGVAQLLAGLVLENVCKAILVSRSSPLNSKGTIDRAFATHDLLALVEKVGITLNEAESRVVEKLQEFVVWAGRYPVPKSSEAMRPRSTPGGGFAPITSGYFPDDGLIFEQVLKKLWQLIPVRFPFKFRGLTPRSRGTRPSP